MKSNDDASVNWVVDTEDGGKFEARYVRRTPEKASIYISTLSGCPRACRFCHLTASKQVTSQQATLQDIQAQALRVLTHIVEGCELPKRVNFNFMARGEPTDSDVLANEYMELADSLMQMVSSVGILGDSRLNISSIVPKGAFERGRMEWLRDENYLLYYSVYSLEPEFRRKWLPQAEDPYEVIRTLGHTTTESYGEKVPVVIHYSMIDGTSSADPDWTRRLRDLLVDEEVRYRVNIVRYNPADPNGSKEAPEERIQECFEILSSGATEPGSRIVPRVGFDVKASCGLFVGF